MSSPGIHISLSAEPIFHLGGFVITNSIFTSLIASSLLILFAVIVRAKLQNTSKPTGIQNFAEMTIEALYNMVHGVTGDKTKTYQFFPVVASFFLFIIMNNYLGLLPGVGTIRIIEQPVDETHAEETIESHSNILVPTVSAEEHIDIIDQNVDHDTQNTDTDTPSNDTHNGPKFVPIFRAGTADLNTTIALGLFSIFFTQFIGIKILGLSYFKKFFNFSDPISAYVGFLELISEFAKIISFAFRLFGNIFAGEVLLTVIAFLVPVIAPMPFYGLELFVGFIQALVFAMLSLVFFNMATLSHDEH